MADIRVLPKSVAELIAAGEVVERPASVIKELCENAIDAGATKITVEIQRGGITYMRVTDNGCGIKSKEVPTAFLRHATSKIKDENDLLKIGTLGFRGEALASISAVSKVEMLTKSREEEIGTRYVIEGGEQKEYDQAGCPDGTTIIVRDIFYNIPARMKFLKKDVSEAMAIATVMDDIALGNPSIAIKFIKDSKTVITTTGDGKLKSAIYTVLGREFSQTLIPVDTETGGIRVWGMISKPVYSRSTRSAQYFFLNGRVIRSAAASKALDTAFKNSVMVGKFPACVLNIELALEKVDVNVHPAKTEVRFLDDKAFFEAVYYAAKNAIMQGDSRPELALKTQTVNKPKTVSPFARITAEEFRKMGEASATPAEKAYRDVMYSQQSLSANKTPAFTEPVKINKIEEKTPLKVESFKEEPRFEEIVSEQKCFITKAEDETRNFTYSDKETLEIKYIGEAFKTYIIVEWQKNIYFIDKHAAHERILFEKLKKERTAEPQMLIAPISVTLSHDEYRAVTENLSLLNEAGFVIEEFGTRSVLVRAVPVELAAEDIMNLTLEVADSLIKSGTVENEKLNDLFHRVACRAAIKGGNDQSPEELLALAERILGDKDIMYCPHGRPVAFCLKRSELEKQFGRIN